MKLKETIKKILTNPIVLNVVTIVAFLNIIGYAILGKYVQVIYFLLLGFLTSFFSKNMIIVLLVPLFIVNVFSKQISQREGLTDMEKEKKEKMEKMEKMEKIVKQNQPKSQLHQHPLDNESTDDTNNESQSNETGEPETFEVGRNKKKNNIDYASTVEDAYDNLNQILGSDGIKRLTNDTQSLMKQQLQLAESMKSMGPLIQGMAPMMEQAQGLLKGMDTGGLGDLMKKFTSGQK